MYIYLYFKRFNFEGFILYNNFKKLAFASLDPESSHPGLDLRNNIGVMEGKDYFHGMEWNMI